MDNFRHAALTSTYANVLDIDATLSTQSPSRAHREPLRGVARGVLLGFVGALCFMNAAGGSEEILNTYTPKQYAYYSLHNHKQYICLTKLYGKESAWNYNAYNRSSGAVGIPQGKSVYLLLANSFEQIDWGLRYIKHRYSTPCNAWAHSKRYGWH